MQGLRFEFWRSAKSATPTALLDDLRHWRGSGMVLAKPENALVPYILQEPLPGQRSSQAQFLGFAKDVTADG